MTYTNIFSISIARFNNLLLAFAFYATFFSLRLSAERSLSSVAAIGGGCL